MEDSLNEIVTLILKHWKISMEGPHLKFTILGVEGIWYEEDSDDKSPWNSSNHKTDWACLLES